MATIDSEEVATFDFGKHAGRAVKDTPTGYLCWIVCDCLRIRPSLLLAVVGELRRRGEDVDVLLRERGDAERHRRERATQDTDPRPADIRPIIDKWYRQLVLDFHPDRGGDTATMQVINEAYRRLLAMLGQG
jgi:hypothetical protein